MNSSADKPFIIFDYDGTLHQCLATYKPALQRALNYLEAIGYGEHVQVDDGCSRWLGINVKEAWAEIAPQAPEYIRDCCVRIVAQSMDADLRAGRAQLYPGVPQMLAALKRDGYEMAVLSNCKHDYMMGHREVFGLDRYLQGFYCAEDFGFIPKSEIFLRIRADFPGRRFVLAGDRYKDLEVARVHNLPCVGCLYGFGSLEELADASAFAHDVSELEAALRSL